MSLTPEDREWIRDVISQANGRSEDRVYRRIKDNALSDITERLDGIDGRLDGMNGQLNGLRGRRMGGSGGHGSDGRVGTCGRVQDDCRQATYTSLATVAAGGRRHSPRPTYYVDTSSFGDWFLPRPSGGQVPTPRLRSLTWLAAIVLPAACGDAEPGPAGVDSATWFSEAEYRFGGDLEQNVLLSGIAVVRADPYRDRVFVLDADDAKISVWTPDGSLEYVVGGRGEGPGEFMSPTRMEFVDGGGVYVQELFGSRFTYYGPDGTLVETVPGVPNSLTYRDYPLRVKAPTGTGGFFAVPQIASSQFVDGGIDGYPLLLARRSDGGDWRAPEPVFRLNSRNWQQPIELGEVGTAWMGQVFSDADLTWIGPGSAVVGRRTGGAGVVELIELDAAGDTAWSRRLEFEPRRLTPEMVREWGDYLVTNITVPGVSPLRLRQAWEEGLHKPEYLPGANSILVTASNEVWLKTFESADTLDVYYAIRRGDVNGTPRRVLLPKSLLLHDATETHVWGVRRDSLDVPYVVGRRLVPG